jgi:hypothetical protein
MRRELMLSCAGVFALMCGCGDGEGESATAGDSSRSASPLVVSKLEEVPYCDAASSWMDSKKSYGTETEKKKGSAAVGQMVHVLDRQETYVCTKRGSEKENYGILRPTSHIPIRTVPEDFYPGSCGERLASLDGILLYPEGSKVRPENTSAVYKCVKSDWVDVSFESNISSTRTWRYTAHSSAPAESSKGVKCRSVAFSDVIIDWFEATLFDTGVIQYSVIGRGEWQTNPGATPALVKSVAFSNSSIIIPDSGTLYRPQWGKFNYSSNSKVSGFPVPGAYVFSSPPVSERIASAKIDVLDSSNSEKFVPKFFFELQEPRCSVEIPASEVNLGEVER